MGLRTALIACWLVAGLTPVQAQTGAAVFDVPKAPAVFETLDAREQWFDTQRTVINKSYNRRLMQILSEYQNCSEGSFHECERSVHALDQAREAALKQLDQNRQGARVMLPSRTVIVDGKKMCLSQNNAGEWHATSCRPEPKISEVTLEGERKCLTKSAPATWREVPCPQ